MDCHQISQSIRAKSKLFLMRYLLHQHFTTDVAITDKTAYGAKLNLRK